MLKQKQTTTLDYLSRYRIKDILIDDDIVTLVRGDDVTFSFNTQGVSGTKGDTGPKGDTGEPGESAYETAVKLGKTTDPQDVWLQSFKGPKGPKGDNGVNGTDGTDGKNGALPQIMMDTVRWLPHDADPYVTVKNEDNVCTISLGIPIGATGEKGLDSNRPDIGTGVYTVGQPGTNAAVSIVDNKLNITVPQGDTGDKGFDSVGLEAYAPTLDIMVNYVGSDQEPSVSCSGDPVTEQPWIKKITVNIPHGETGEQGPRGEQGEDRIKTAPAVFKIVTAEDEVQNPGRGFSVISVDNLGGFSGKAYGWCWRTNAKTLQVVRFVNKSNGYYTGWWYRTGPATGLVDSTITTGWKKV